MWERRMGILWALCLLGISRFCFGPAVIWALCCGWQDALPGCKDRGGFAGNFHSAQHSWHVHVELVHAGVAHAIQEMELPNSTAQGPRRKAQAEMSNDMTWLTGVNCCASSQPLKAQLKCQEHKSWATHLFLFSALWYCFFFFTAAGFLQQLSVIEWPLLWKLNILSPLTLLSSCLFK